MTPIYGRFINAIRTPIHHQPPFMFEIFRPPPIYAHASTGSCWEARMIALTSTSPEAPPASHQCSPLLLLLYILRPMRPTSKWSAIYVHRDPKGESFVGNANQSKGDKGDPIYLFQLLSEDSLTGTPPITEVKVEMTAPTVRSWSYPRNRMNKHSTALPPPLPPGLTERVCLLISARPTPS